MKTAISIVFSLIVFHPQVSSQTTDYIEMLKSDDVLRIDYAGYCETSEFNRIEVINKDGNLIVNRIERTLYVGEKPTQIWSRVIDEESKKIINEFIYNCKYEQRENVSSSWIEKYEITLNDSIIFQSNEDNRWSINYYSMEEGLFRNEFNNLNEERSKLEKTIISILANRWILGQPLTSLKRHDTIILNSALDDSSWTWKFSEKNKFKANKQESKFADLKNYSLDIDEGSIFLTIESRWKKKIFQSSDLVNGATFKIIEYNSDSIKLEFLW